MRAPPNNPLLNCMVERQWNVQFHSGQVKQCMPLIDCIERNCTSLALDQMASPRSIKTPCTDAIPSQIWHLMPQLENVLLGNNMLTGTIPKELVELPHLTYILVKNNLFTET